MRNFIKKLAKVQKDCSKGAIFTGSTDVRKRSDFHCYLWRLKVWSPPVSNYVFYCPIHLSTILPSQCLQRTTRGVLQCLVDSVSSLEIPGTETCARLLPMTRRSTANLPRSKVVSIHGLAPHLRSIHRRVYNKFTVVICHNKQKVLVD